MRKILFSLLLLSVFASPPLAFGWTGEPATSVNLANSAGRSVAPRQNLAKGDANSVPVGGVIIWTVASNPPEADKWLECNGQAISPTVYPELYALVGANVPNFQGVFLRGFGGQYSSHYGWVYHGSDGLGALQGDTSRNITGSVSDFTTGWQAMRWGDAGALRRNFGQTRVRYAGPVGEGWYEAPDVAYHADIWLDASRMTPTSVENRPVNKAVRYLIRARP